MFRGRRGDLIKILWATEDGLWLLAKSKAALVQLRSLLCTPRCPIRASVERRHRS
ncbi:hypothetical protein J8I87_39520 [Paraburkholderia sp. LEh10]|nr:hypothetical protein [Paraburkholderia sp. LEh10]